MDISVVDRKPQQSKIPVKADCHCHMEDKKGKKGEMLVNLLIIATLLSIIISIKKLAGNA